MAGDPIATAPVERMSWAEMRRRMKADRRALERCLAERGRSPVCISWSPSFVCVALYRFSRYLYLRRHTFLARLVWQIDLFLTSADISPISELGEGLLVIHPVAVTIVGRAGRNLVVEGFGGMGGGLNMKDVGAGPGLPQLGDDVHLARGAMVLGPVIVGNSVRVGPGCTVTRDLPDFSEVLEPEIRIRTTRQPGAASDHV